MTNVSGRKGTAAESAVVKQFARYWPEALRPRLVGAKDVGDVANVPDLVIEVKGGSAAENASDQQIELWLDETDRERQNAGAHYGVLVVKRKGFGYPSAGRWWAITREFGYTAKPMTTRVYLDDYIEEHRAKLFIASQFPVGE